MRPAIRLIRSAGCQPKRTKVFCFFFSKKKTFLVFLSKDGTLDTTKLDSGGTAGRETEAERDFRMAWEADKIREAEADIVAGRLVDSAKVRLWIDSIGADNQRPVPFSVR